MNDYNAEVEGREKTKITPQMDNLYDDSTSDQIRLSDKSRRGIYEESVTEEDLDYAKIGPVRPDCGRDY